MGICKGISIRNSNSNKRRIKKLSGIKFKSTCFCEKEEKTIRATPPLSFSFLVLYPLPVPLLLDILCQNFLLGIFPIPISSTPPIGSKPLIVTLYFRHWSVNPDF